MTRQLAELFLSLVKQVVDSRHLVVAVCVQTRLSIVWFEPVLFQLHHDGVLQRNFVLADDEALVVYYGLVILRVPRMLFDLISGEPFIGVYVKNLVDEISTTIGYPVRYVKLAVQDFLVKNVSVRVFERQISTDHGEQDDATAPDVYPGSVILFSGDHLRGSVAGRAARGL